MNPQVLFANTLFYRAPESEVVLYTCPKIRYYKKDNFLRITEKYVSNWGKGER